VLTILYIIYEYRFCYISVVVCGFQLGPLGIAATNRPIVPAPGDYDDGEIGGIIGRETEVLGDNLPQCLFVHHEPHMPARTRSRAAVVGSQRLTA
jgi:hypothetical protein